MAKHLGHDILQTVIVLRSFKQIWSPGSEDDTSGVKYVERLPLTQLSVPLI